LRGCRGVRRGDVRRRLTIVSGLALGIDAAAHRGGLTGAGSSIAVIGTGPIASTLRAIAPLRTSLPRAGLVISEFAVGTPPLKQNFPRAIGS
jgi:DNA processing protein